MNHGGRPVAARQLGGVGARQPPPGGIPDTGLPGQHGPAPDGLAYAQRVQRAQRVGPQAQAGAGLGELGRALLARYELALEATRRPELRQALVTSGATIRAMVADQFAAAGIREPRSCAADFVAFLDGLLFDQIAGAGARELTSVHLRAAIGTLLAAVTGTGC